MENDIFFLSSVSSYAQTHNQMMQSPISMFVELLSSLPPSFSIPRNNQSNDTADEKDLWVTLTIPNTLKC